MIDGPRWEGLTHPEIYDRVVTRAPQFPTSVSAAAADLWAEGQALIPRIDERIARAMQRSAEGWGGAAAEAARSAMTPLSQWALDSTGDAKLTLDGVELQANQAKVVRDSMPAPDMAAWSGTGEPPLSMPGSILTDQAAVEYRAAESAAHAVDLMNTYTTHSYEARSYLDYWSIPPQVTVEVAPASSGTSGAGVGGWGGVGTGMGGSTPVGAAGVAPGGPGPAGGAGGGGLGAAGGPGPSAAPTVTGGAGAAGAGTGAAGVGGLPAAAGAAGAGANRTGVPVTTVPGRATGPGGTTRDGGTGIGAVPGRTGPTPLVGVARPGVDSGFRPIVPGPPPRTTPSPTWRDVVRSTLGPEPPARAGAGRGAGYGSGVFGDPPAAPGRGTGQPGSPGIPGGEARPGGARTAQSGHPGVMAPMSSGGAGGQGREHRRPSYLVDDSDAFVDDRWVTLPVIGPDDPLPRHG